MKKSKLNALLLTSLCLIIMSTGCGQNQANDNESKTESETSVTNPSEDVSGNSNEDINVAAAEEEKPPYDFLYKWNEFQVPACQDSFIALKGSIKDPIHVESTELMDKSGYTFLDATAPYCAIDGISPDALFNTFDKWYPVQSLIEGEPINTDNVSDFLPMAIFTKYPDENVRFCIDTQSQIDGLINVEFCFPGFYPALYDLELVDSDNNVIETLSSTSYPLPDGTEAQIAGYASAGFYLNEISDYKKGEVLTLELKISEKNDFTDK